jgi:hypothetical protein
MAKGTKKDNFNQVLGRLKVERHGETIDKMNKDKDKDLQILNNGKDNVNNIINEGRNHISREREKLKGKINN